MNTMHIEFLFERTKFHLADLDCWALSHLNIPESELDQFYGKFLNQLVGTRFNVYEIAENIIDFFDIEPNVKRAGFTEVFNDSRIDVMDVLNIEMNKEEITVSLTPLYLGSIKEYYLPRPLGPRVFSRRCSVSF